MTLPWVRIDTGLPQHDKILELLGDTAAPPARRWQAFASYVSSICWSAQQGTDGHIPRTALPYVHGTTGTANLLVHHLLWEPNLTGWRVHNYELRQEMADVTEAKRHGLVRQGSKGACRRWHGPNCWKEPGGCSR